MGKIDNFSDSELVNTSIDPGKEKRYNPTPQDEHQEFIDTVCQILKFYKKYKEGHDE